MIAVPASRLPMRLSLVALAVAALGACQQRATPAVTEPSPIVPAPLALPTGSGCGPEIARTKAIVDSDVATGNLNKPVGDRFSADLAHAAAECSAGKSGEALHLLAAAKSRYGYR
ncbi:MULTISPECIES: hypothetical protein [Methylobacterium]|jgi:hypothetical protein|uniref:hypothetical protein n=1 Tax=Methylobacterium TaxID=407 RepID=UPI00037E3B25|nr:MULTISPECIES: hypothetical protein [unclassified Methylobacterium]KQS84658.1 hypothetical protein ASG32_20225 [Methylobacterium sp. Leaf361]